MSYKKESRIYDKIAANRISKIDGGIDLHVAIGSRHSITLRNKMKRLGLDGEHIEDLLKMVDEIGYQKTLESTPLGVRFSTVKRRGLKPKIWKKFDD